jgi:type I restriction enzyme S subunit
MLASERFSRQLFSRNLSPYRVAQRLSIVLDPMLLWDGSIGLQDVVDEGLVSPDYRVYRCLGPVDPRFIGYLVREPGAKRHYQTGARGTNVRRNRIARSDFRRIPLLLPPLPVQRKIAAILSSIDDTIASTISLIGALSALSMAVTERFIREGLSASSGCSISRLGDLLLSCDYGISSALSADTSGVPILRMGNLRDGELDLADLKFAPREVFADGDLYLKAGDVLFNRTNSADKVGKVAAYRGGEQPLAFASYLLRLRPKAEVCDGIWLSYVLNADSRQRRLRAMATPGVSQVNINRPQLLAEEIPVPPLAEQRRISNHLDSLRSRIKREGDFKTGVEVLKRSLLSDLLSGRVRVALDEAVA